MKEPQTTFVNGVNPFVRIRVGSLVPARPAVEPKVPIKRVVSPVRKRVRVRPAAEPKAPVKRVGTPSTRKGMRIFGRPTPVQNAVLAWLKWHPNTTMQEISDAFLSKYINMTGVMRKLMDTKRVTRTPHIEKKSLTYRYELPGDAP